MGAEFVLSMMKISKEYYGNPVLRDATLTVRPGEIHALLGENGAGKSTLMNVLFGMPVIHQTGGFSGEVLIDGKKIHIASPHDAMNKGLGMVHQEFMLLPGFTIAENIKLNREITTPSLVSRVFGSKLRTLDMEAMCSDSRKALDSVGLSLSERTLVKGLPVGYMQFVEIAREIDKTGIKVMVFDEPTAVLTESEADRLLEVMREIAATGIAIIFITHRLNEVMAVCDNATILRDGKLVATRNTADTSALELAELMIGRKESESESGEAQRHKVSGGIAMKIQHLAVEMPGERVKDVNLEVREGEIFGIGGLAGQGKIGIPNGIMGLYPATGDITFFGNKLPLNDAGNALRSGLSMVSEDRRGVGLLLDQSIEDNIAFNAMQIKGEYLWGKLFTQKRTRQIRKRAKQMIKELDIRCTSSLQRAGTLSGGNQQKVCIARALAMNPRFLFVSEPTRGIDIGAKKLVLDTLVRLNQELGMTIVMVSSELQELKAICDRIAIVAEGREIDVLDVDASNADFGVAMSGEKPQRKVGAQ